jgi:polysaccharide pyruvyl transferase WcaK-like protein
MDQNRLVAAGVQLLRSAAALGATPVLYALNHFAHDDDRVIHREIAAASGLGERVLVVEQELPPAEAQGLFGRMELMVGMRLHACVLALGAGTPALGIAYDSKVRKVLHSLGQGDCVIPLAEMESAPARMEEMWRCRERRRLEVQRTVESERRRFHEVFGRAIGKVFPG